MNLIQNLILILFLLSFLFKMIRSTITLIKWMPIVLTISILLSFIFILCDVVIIKLLYPLTSSLIMTVLLFMLSIVFKFCKWHRLLIMNLFFVALITWINSAFYRFPNLTIVHIILTTSTIASIVSLLLYKKYGCFKCSR